MIEALIRTRSNDKGDIIVAKLPGAVWGAMELKTHQLIELDDIDLENKLKQLQKAGEKFPVISNPYMKIEEVIDRNGKRRINVLEKSTRYVDFNSISTEKKIDIEDISKQATKLITSDYTLAVKTVEVKTVEDGDKTVEDGVK